MFRRLATMAWAMLVACSDAPTSEVHEAITSARTALAEHRHPEAAAVLERALTNLEPNEAEERDLHLTLLEVHAYADFDRGWTTFEDLTRQFEVDATLYEHALKRVFRTGHWGLALRIIDHARSTDIAFTTEMLLIESHVIRSAYAECAWPRSAPDDMTTASTKNARPSDIAKLARKDPVAAVEMIDNLLAHNEVHVDAAERHTITRSIAAAGHYALAEYFLRRAVEREGVESDADTSLFAILRSHDGTRVDEFWSQSPEYWPRPIDRGLLMRLRPFDCYADDDR